MAHITVTTYNRPEKCLFTLMQLDGMGRVSVFRDRCDKDYSAVERYCKKKGYHYQVTDTHLGKWGYWKLHNMMYEHLEKQDYTHYIQLPDDALLVDNFLPRAVGLLKDELSCVGIFTTEKMVQKHVHKERLPQRRVRGEVLIEVGWLDCCLVTTKRVMDGFRIKRNKRSRIKNPLKNSGVGIEQAEAYFKKTGRRAQLSYYALLSDYFEYEGDTVMHDPVYINKFHTNRKRFSLKDEDREYIKAKYETQHRLSVQAQGHLGAEIQHQEP